MRLTRRFSPSARGWRHKDARSTTPAGLLCPRSAAPRVPPCTTPPSDSPSAVLTALNLDLLITRAFSLFQVKQHNQDQSSRKEPQHFSRRHSLPSNSGASGGQHADAKCMKGRRLSTHSTVRCQFL